VRAVGAARRALQYSPVPDLCLGRMRPGFSQWVPSLSGLCRVDDSGGNRSGQFYVVISMARNNSTSNAQRDRRPAGLCIGQRPNHSVCAVLGAEAGARAPFSSPDPSFADSRRRYPRVCCRHDRMERTVLVHRKLGRDFALPILEFPAMGPAMAADRYASGSP
jgi:hypothetical protein